MSIEFEEKNAKERRVLESVRIWDRKNLSPEQILDEMDGKREGRIAFAEQFFRTNPNNDEENYYE